MSLDRDLERLMAGGRVLVGVDFDGTLAPIADHPDLAIPDPRAVELLETLADRPGIAVVVVSGRALADLQIRLGEIQGVTLVGEHGNDLGGESSGDHTISEAVAMVTELAEQVGGATVETKPRSVTFHYRNLPEEVAAEALARIEAWVADHDRVRLLEGKQVHELSTAIRNKGDAVRDLAAERRTIYIGDDTTDEAVFEMLGPDDIGVKVGGGLTAARYRVEDVAGVVTILEKIALASR